MTNPINKGKITTPDNPGDSKLMLWIAEHRDYAGSDCLIWPFGRGQNGYAYIGRPGGGYYVHRYMCERLRGPAPTPKHHAAHSCGRGEDGCVNPQHLSWKTNSENQLDRHQHGTAKNGKRWKLTPEQVAEIRAQQGIEPVAELARRFGIKDATVRQIHSGRIWRAGTYVTAGFTPETSRAANAKRRPQTSGQGTEK